MKRATEPGRGAVKGLLLSTNGNPPTPTVGTTATQSCQNRRGNRQPNQQIKIFHRSPKVKEHLENWKNPTFQEHWAWVSVLVTVTWHHEGNRTLTQSDSASKKGSKKGVASTHTNFLMSLDQVNFHYLRSSEATARYILRQLKVLCKAAQLAKQQ